MLNKIQVHPTNHPNDTSNNLVCGLTGAGSMSLVPVLVHSRETGITVETLAFLDNGSDAVFVSEELQQQLNAKGKTTKIQIRTVNDDKPSRQCNTQWIRTFRH